MSWLDVLAATVMALFWVFLVGPVVFSGDNTKYTDAVICTVGITAFLIVLVVVLAAVVWAVHQLAS